LTVKIIISVARSGAITYSLTCVIIEFTHWNWAPVVTQLKEGGNGFYFGVGPRGQFGMDITINDERYRFDPFIIFEPANDMLGMGGLGRLPPHPSRRHPE